MRRKLPRSSLLLAALAVGVAIATSIVVGDRLAELEARAATVGTLRPVVVAAADRARGEALGPDDLRVVEVPAAAVPAGALRRPAEAAGATLAADVTAGEMLTPARLARAGPVAALVPPGLRALPVTVGTPPGLLVPGDRVDVLGVRPGRPFAEVLAADVEVALVRESAIAEAAATTVVLVLSPDDAARVAGGRAAADLVLSVAPPGEAAAGATIPAGEAPVSG